MPSIIYYNALSIVCVIAAVTMAIYNKDGWGWFLFVAVITACGPADKDNDNDKDHKKVI